MTDFPYRAIRDCRRILRTASAANAPWGYSVATLRTNATVRCVQILAEVAR